MTVHITAIYAGLCGLLIIALAYNVTTFRRRKVGPHHPHFDAMQVAIRAHGNATEYVPIALILLLLAELNGTDEVWVHFFGGAFVASRAAHAWGFINSGGGISRGRFLGTATCFLVIAALSVLNIYCFISG
jgi:uncharacterized protein